MSKRRLIDLTQIMRDQSILRIARFTFDGRELFNVALEGDILGTGETVGEAYQNAVNQREARTVQVAA